MTGLAELLRPLVKIVSTGNFSALCGALHKADYVDRSIMWN